MCKYESGTELIDYRLIGKVFRVAALLVDAAMQLEEEVLTLLESGIIFSRQCTDYATTYKVILATQS